jgi:hypothetical protein
MPEEKITEENKMQDMEKDMNPEETEKNDVEAGKADEVSIRENNEEIVLLPVRSLELDSKRTSSDNNLEPRDTVTGENSNQGNMQDSTITTENKVPVCDNSPIPKTAENGQAYIVYCDPRENGATYDMGGKQIYPPEGGAQSVIEEPDDSRYIKIKSPADAGATYSMR